MVRRVAATVLLLIGCEATPEPEGPSCGETRAAILEDCGSLHMELLACYDDVDEDGMYDFVLCKSIGDAHRQCAEDLGGFDVLNGTGEYTAYDVVGYCDHDSPSGDMWCPEAEMGCELPD